jgi:hypothetical protein
VIEDGVHTEAIVPQNELPAIPGPFGEYAVLLAITSLKAMSQKGALLAPGSYSFRTFLDPEERAGRNVAKSFGRA